MVIWIAMAVLAAAAFVPVLMALTRARSERPDAGRPTVAIYRDQLSEVDRDVGRGLIGESEAAAARTEIARRLIRAGEDETEAPATPPAGGQARRFATIAVVAMPIAALGLYLAIGSPQLPDEPLAARLSASPQSQDIATLVARVEQHLAANPDDGAGWEVVAPVYVRLGRYTDAVRAYHNALRILGSNADDEGGLGQAIVAANDGTVTADARAAFQRAEKLAPDDPRPKFFLALWLTQQGRHDEAVTAWHRLVAGAPADAPWLPAAKQQLAELEGTVPPAATAPGPSPADIKAASQLDAGQRQAMVEGMVAKLAKRLETDTGDAQGWSQLIRSYMVLNRPGDARAALDKAHAALAGDAAKTAVIDATARDFGLMPPQAVATQAPPAASAPGPSAADVQAASKLDPSQQHAMIEGMVAKLASRLETDTGDAEGWAQLVRSYAVLGRPDDARAALAKAHTALANDADKIALVDATARDVGLMPSGATPAPPVAAAPGPSAADVEAARQLAPSQQQAMIEGMVAKLAAQLETDGSDADGWARLIRSYMVLGRPDDARAALDKAHTALASDADKTALVDATARDVGLTP
jgi:cytochrome c-type biogenesis protein CcmH